MIEVIKYTSNHKKGWDEHVLNAKNGHFMFQRRYIAYHGDRFKDHSLLFFNKDKLIAVFPANEEHNQIYSHAGLSFGGVVLHSHILLHEVLSVFYHLVKYYYSQGFDIVHYKSIPSFYYQKPAYEEEYALFLLESESYRIDANFVLDLKLKEVFQQRRKRGVQKALKAGLRLVEDDDFGVFWKYVLEPNLKERHGLAPVHTDLEIAVLHKRFPEHIGLYKVMSGKALMAGAVLYKNHDVVHAQYIASTEVGREKGALDYLFDHLIHSRFSHYAYFSFGVSTEDQGRYLNQGLASWKEGFGARCWPHRFFKIATNNFDKLKGYDI
jgi:hypothetical protein